MDYDQHNPENSNFPYNLNQSNQNQNNIDNIEKINNTLDDNYKKYIMNKNQKVQYTLDIDSSREEINSKEEIIQTKDEEEIENLGTGKFRFLNTITEQEDNKKEKELNDEKQDYIITVNSYLLLKNIKKILYCKYNIIKKYFFNFYFFVNNS